MSDPISTIRYTAAKVLAHVVSDFFPGTQLAGSGITDTGFYSDFLLNKPIDEQALPLIEERMRALIKSDLPIKRMEMMRGNASAYFIHHQQPLLAQLVAQQSGNLVDVMEIGHFRDLSDPHCGSSTLDAGSIKLIKLIPKGKLIRLEGTAFEDNQKLKQFLKKVEGSKKRDHRVLGQEMKLFAFSEELAPGTTTWLPKGIALKKLLIRFLDVEQEKREYQAISTPKIVKSHLKNDNCLTIEGEKYDLGLDPAIFHLAAFKNMSYNQYDLPVRFSEWVDFFEGYKESESAGLLRSRTWIEDREFSFCQTQDLESELISSLHFINKTIKIFGFEYHWYVPARGQKAAGSKGDWERGGQAIKNALQHCGFEYKIAGESKAGPRLEARIVDCLGREWSTAFMGIDLRYLDPGVPMMLVRSIYGSLDRWIALLLEHYAGQLPFWLAPEQVRVVSIGDKSVEYARKKAEEIRAEGFRVGLNVRSENLGAKVHTAERERVPYMVIVGDKEEKNEVVTLRSCYQEVVESGIKLDVLLKRLRGEEERSKAVPNLEVGSRLESK